METLKDKIFDRYYIDCEKADNVCQELGINRADLIKYSKEIDAERATELKEMRRIRQLYRNKDEDEMDFPSFNTFYRWYIGKYEEQKGCCYYCGTDERLIAEFIDKKKEFIKRPNRGKHLEVERKDAKSNKYNAKNCVLACYFCNNDKSDIFNEDEYFKYLKDRKAFFTKQLNSLK